MINKVTTFSLNLWIKLKRLVEKQPFAWSFSIFCSFFSLKYILWISVPNEVPLVVTALALISVTAGLRYGLIFLLPAFFVEYYFFTPAYFSSSITDPYVLLNLLAYAIIHIFVSVSFGSQHAMEKEMDRVLKKQQEWIGVASHELKTPLNGISGACRLLKKRLVNNEDVKYLELIERSAWHLNKIVSDLLDLSKLSSGQTEDVDFKISDLIDSACKIMSVYAAEKNLKLLVSDECLTKIVRGDQFKIQQVLVNLIENAVKYTTTGEIIVHSSIERNNGGDFLFVRVRDTGVGISENEFKHIFTPFYRISHSKNYVAGSGLGLSICKKIIDLLGGAIGVSSQIGVGSEFWFQVPIQESDALIEGASEKNRCSQRCDSPKALVAEDNEISRILICQDLLDMNIEVEVVPNGAEAIDRSKRYEYDFILLDCQMPVVGGFEAAVKIREHYRRKNLTAPPIIGFTADTTDSCRQSAINSGMDFLIYKPVRVQELKSLLGEILPHLRKSSARDIHSIFIAKLPERLKELNKLTEQKDWGALRRRVHFLRSSCLAIDNAPSAELCKSIEFDCESNLHEGIREKIQNLRNILTHI